MGCYILLYAGIPGIFLDPASDAFRVRPVAALAQKDGLRRSADQFVSSGQVVIQSYHGWSSNWKDALLFTFASHFYKSILPIHVRQIQRRKLANPHTCRI
jgi:hypothetical protein